MVTVAQWGIGAVTSHTLLSSESVTEWRAGSEDVTRARKVARQSSMTSTAETLDQIQVFWSILLLPATIILNVTAFLMLLKSSGSCLVSPLLSVIG